MKRQVAFRYAICSVVILTMSCTANHYRITRATAELQVVEGSQNCWGKIAVSDLAFVANKGQYNIDYNEGVTNYVQAARSNISGDASTSLQTSLYAGALVQGMFAPPVSLGSPANSTNLPSQINIPNQAETAVNSFPQPPAPSGPNPTTDERDAVDKGINDKIAETFLKFMANPTLDSNHEVIVFGVMQATCQPGEFTRKGYLAELDVSVNYGRQRIIQEYTTNKDGSPEVEPAFDLDTGRTILITNFVSFPKTEPKPQQISGRMYYLASTNKTIEVKPRIHPSVLAVLPLMDSRNMDLRNNSQNQIEVALALSAAFAAKGMNAAANVLSDYVKRQQSQIETLNSLPVATTYSDGPNFGFQLYPDAQAIENPGKSGSSSGNVLKPVTFPIVVAIKVVHDEVDDGTNVWNYLVTETQTRWIPIKWQFWPWLDQIVSIGGYEFGNDVPLYERLLRARKIDEAQANLNKIAPLGAQFTSTVPPEYRFQYRQLQIAIDSLKTSALSYEVAHELPPDLFPTNTNALNGPSISDAYPHSIWRDRDTTFTLLVKGVSNINQVLSVTIAGVPCQIAKIISYGSGDAAATNSNIAGSAVVTNLAAPGIALTATLPASFYSITNTATNNIDFVVSLKDAAPVTKTIGMTLQGRTAPEAIATISRDSSGKVLSIDLKPGKDVNDKQLLDAIKEVLQKSEAPPKATTIVQ